MKQTDKHKNPTSPFSDVTEIGCTVPSDITKTRKKLVLACRRSFGVHVEAIYTYTTVVLLGRLGGTVWRRILETIIRGCQKGQPAGKLSVNNCDIPVIWSSVNRPATYLLIVVQSSVDWLIDWILAQAYLKNPARGHKVEIHLNTKAKNTSPTYL